MEHMIVTIKNGSVEIDIEGGRGVRCVELTQTVENLIRKVESRLFKKDFYANIEIEQNLCIEQFNKRESL
jgi:hypothetical protein